jgi:ketosteroid isomerase-like protein
MTQQNKDTVRRVFEEIWSDSKIELVDELYCEAYVAHIANTPEEVRGTERFKQFIALYGAVAPDLHFQVQDQIAEADKVATRWVARGSPMGGAAEQMVITGISIHRLEDGKIAESWDNWDALSAIQAVGADLFETVSLSL